MVRYRFLKTNGWVLHMKQDRGFLFLEPLLGMALSKTQTEEVGARVSVDGKSEGSCVGDIVCVN